MSFLYISPKLHQFISFVSLRKYRCINPKGILIFTLLDKSVFLGNVESLDMAFAIVT